MGVTRTLADYCNSLSYQQLPPEVVDKAKYLAVDFLGVATRGSLTESSEVVRHFIKDIGNGTKEGVIIGTDMKASYQYAALANGTASHSIELDDVINEASAHPGVVVFPTTFAAAEMMRSDGKKFIEAVVLGYEVMVRLGKALNPANHYARGFHPTGTCGAFGAAIAASKLFNLDAKQMTNALGIVGSQASGSMEFLADGTWTKRLNPGWAAHNGIIAALLAKRGFTGPATILEGRFGFLHAYSDDSDASELLTGLGDDFKIMKISVKPHACCRYKQGPIDGIIEIMRENKLKAQEIEKVTLGILKPGLPIVAEPGEPKYNPRTIVDAQFSMPFGAAVALLYGNASLEQYTVSRLKSSEVKEMMRRVYCVSDPELDKVFPEKWPATVEIIIKNGRKFSTRVDYPKGDPENPLSWQEVEEKFNGLSFKVFPQGRRKQILSKVRSLETEANICNLTNLLQGKHRS